MRRKIEKGYIKKEGKFQNVIMSHKSTPGDGVHSKGKKGGGDKSLVCNF